jgi:membrane carboxypeptidase/penicillin-binding protein
MGALSSIAALAGAGVSVYGTMRQARQQSATDRAQADLAQQQERSRQQELAVQQEADRAQRQQTLSRTIASTRARLAAGGVAPDEGSAGAITTGLERTAAEAQDASDEAFRARLSRGRASLLNPDGTLTAALQAARGFGATARSLLD